MSKKTYENLKESMCYELDGLAKRGDITKDTLDSMYKLIKSIKNLDELTEKEEGKSSGYSMDYSRRMWNDRMNSYAMNDGRMSNAGGTSYNANTSYDGNMSNAGEMSNRRGMSNDMGNSNEYSRDSYEGGSNDYGTSNARRGRDGDGDGRYSEDYSSARGRDARGRYTSRDGRSYDRGYSRHSAKDRVIQRLEDMLDESKSQSEQIAIMRCIEELQD